MHTRLPPIGLLLVPSLQFSPIDCAEKRLVEFVVGTFAIVNLNDAATLVVLQICQQLFEALRSKRMTTSLIDQEDHLSGLNLKGKHHLFENNRGADEIQLAEFDMQSLHPFFEAPFTRRRAAVPFLLTHHPILLEGYHLILTFFVKDDPRPAKEVSLWSDGLSKNPVAAIGNQVIYFHATIINCYLLIVNCYLPIVIC